MKTKTEFRIWRWTPLGKRLALPTGALMLCVTAINGMAQTYTVTNCTEAALRAAMAGGGTVIFACDGVITLAGTITNDNDMVLDGSGHNITISGGNTVRVLYNSTNTSFSLLNLTIANGRCTNGAGIFNDGGTVSLSNVSFETNVAYVYTNEPFGPEGGAIYDRAGTVNATNCNFFGNAAAPPPKYQGPFEARGGAIRDQGGFVCLKDCVFAGNSACGGIVPSWAGSSFSPGANGAGGAVYNDTGASLIASGCEFSTNSASGGPGSIGSSSGYYANRGGSGTGGAVFNSGVMEVDACTFRQNSGVGAAGGGNPGSVGNFDGGSGNGGGIFNSGSLVVQSNAFLNNTVCGGSGGNAGAGQMTGFTGGTGGSGSGGGICNLGSLFLQGSTFADNAATGAGGGQGGNGAPAGGLTAAQPGGTGGLGGSGNGGALFNSGTASLFDSTLVTNMGSGSMGGGGGTGGSSFGAPHQPNGGNGGNGGTGGSGFGGVYVESGSVKITNCTIAYNLGTPGQGGAGGQGGPSDYFPGAPGKPGTNGMAAGGIRALGSLTINTILAGNSPSNFSGTITDAGHNLSSDNSCAFTNVGSLNNTDPILGPLADNGGPTLTMALLPGSPAIDAGDNSAAPPTDQRGFPRVVGPNMDIGAYERCYLPVLQINPLQTNTVNILVYGLPDQACQLMRGNTLATCVPVATNQIGAKGSTVFQDSCGPGQTCRFYRAMVP